MDKENILAVNVPNAVSILIMAVVGLFVLAFVRKTVKAKLGAANPLASSAGQSPAMGNVVG